MPQEEWGTKMASGCEWFYTNVAKASRVIARHPVRTAAAIPAIAGGSMLVGRASGTRGLRGQSSGGY